MSNLSPKLTRGNEKIKEALVWSIPSGKTCPGATKLCSVICYARQSEIQYHNVVPPSRWHNLRLTKRADFAEIMIKALKRRRYRALRIHESGDFYSQVYLNKWVGIIKALPEWIFWAYTKSHSLDFSEALKLPNLNLRYSVDATTKKYPKQDMPLAHLSMHQPDGAFECPGTGAAGGIKCARDCKVCMETSKSIWFHPHGTHRKKIERFESITPEHESSRILAGA